MWTLTDSRPKCRLDLLGFTGGEFSLSLKAAFSNKRSGGFLFTQ